MTSAGHAAGAAQQAAGQTASTAKDEASQTAHTAASAAGDVAGTAKEQAGHVAGEAVNQVRQLADEARSEASTQMSSATDKLSERIRSLAGEVRDLGEGKADGSGTAAGLAQQLARTGEQLADHLAQAGPGGLVQDLRSFAARKPGTFLLGALAAGVATGRLVRGATAGSSGGSSSTYRTTATGATSRAYAVPVVEPYPATAPVPLSATGDVLDDGSIGPVSGDSRLVREGGLAAPYEPATPYEPGAPYEPAAPYEPGAPYEPVTERR